MPSLKAPQQHKHRKRASDSDDSEDADEFPISPSSRRSGASKRAKTAGHGLSSPFSPVDGDDGTSTANGASQRINGNDRDEDEYQAGAITRVQLTNFITYEDVVFYPGPYLNMVIGPNGTGKSSLVCAICIGLGYAAVNLGRAAKFGEFVKHGTDEATIEIELQRRPEDRENYVIKVRVTRDGDKRKWWLNGSETSLKNIQQLVRSLGIQVDNLCQFLPQDRVSEFAALSPVELLHETQRAAAAPEMLAWHDELKSLRKGQKELQLSVETDQETLNIQEERQEGLLGDVERLRERAEIQEKIAMLEKSVPFVEYRVARNQFHDSKNRAKEAQNRVRALEAEVAPTLEAVNDKQDYHALIDAVVKERKKDLHDAERAADSFFTRIEEVDDSVKKLEQTNSSEKDGEKARKQQLITIQRKIGDLEAQLQNEPPQFDAAEWNGKIRAQEHRFREIDTETRQLDEQLANLNRQGNAVRKEIGDKERELGLLDSQQGKNITKLKRISAETAKAWEWIEANRDQFERDVYGPPLIECSVKDPRYVDAVESLLQRNDFLTITAQTSADFKKLGDQLYGNMRLADITLKTMTKDLAQVRHSPLPSQQLQGMGLDGWAIDYLDGPQPVLAMLCGSVRLDRTAVGLRDMSEDQYNALLASPVATFVAGRHHYNVQRRREYGDAATSTTTKTVRQARNWTDQPLDTGIRRDVEEKIESLRQQFQTMKDEVVPLKEKMAELRIEKSTLDANIKSLKEGKNEAQMIAGKFKAIPAKLDRERENLQAKKLAGEEYRSRMRQLKLQKDELALKKTAFSLTYKARIEAIRTAHHSLLEAKLRLLEAASDVEALKERNSGIVRQLEEVRQLKRLADVERDIAKKAAAAALAVCQTLLEEGENSGYFETLDQNLTIEQLETEIEAEKSKLEYIHDGNPGALKEFELRSVNIERLQAKIADSQAQLDDLNARINSVRTKWEPELDKLISEISGAFAHNFEQIGCAGEVGVHKDDDFDLWAIEIKVKFRENETLQLLDQHRQSGGERSVSTIFYLMALQSLARSPFRVVDEINQGMDPRNERMVHGRMVEIACQVHTSQYFLITPKLLPGLKYDRRMKVLCIASGEHMPLDHRQLDIRKLIANKRALSLAVN